MNATLLNLLIQAVIIFAPGAALVLIVQWQWRRFRRRRSPRVAPVEVRFVPVFQPQAMPVDSPADKEAVLVCTKLGVRRPDAERLLRRVKAEKPGLADVAGLSSEMLRLRTCAVAA